jgi:hypothetical protein
MVEEGSAGVDSRMSNGKGGKEKLTPTSSIMFTWHWYRPGFKDCRGKSIWKMTPPNGLEIIPSPIFPESGEESSRLILQRD